MFHLVLVGNGGTTHAPFQPPADAAQRWPVSLVLLVKFIHNLVGGLVAIFYFPIYWVAVIIPIDEVIFFRTGWPKTTNQQSYWTWSVYWWLLGVWTFDPDVMSNHKGVICVLRALANVPRWKRHDQHMEHRQAVRLCPSSVARAGFQLLKSPQRLRLDCLLIGFCLIIDDYWIDCLDCLEWLLRLLPVWESQQNPAKGSPFQVWNDSSTFQVSCDSGRALSCKVHFWTPTCWTLLNLNSNETRCSPNIWSEHRGFGLAVGCMGCMGQPLRDSEAKISSPMLSTLRTPTPATMPRPGGYVAATGRPKTAGRLLATDGSFSMGRITSKECWVQRKHAKATISILEQCSNVFECLQKNSPKQT